jgi:hypothetical protein
MDNELQFKTCEHLLVHGLVFVFIATSRVIIIEQILPSKLQNRCKSLAKFPKLKQYAITIWHDHHIQEPNLNNFCHYFYVHEFQTWGD